MPNGIETYTYMNIIQMECTSAFSSVYVAIIEKKRGLEFEREQGRDYGREGRKERRGEVT